MPRIPETTASLTRRTLSANVLDGVRREQLNGETFIVAPVVLVREKVLNGTLMTADALRRSVAGSSGAEAATGPAGLVDQWEEIPITLGHPPEGLTLQAELEWVESHRVGHVQNVRFVDGALAGEAWLPITQKSATVAAAVEAIEQGKAIDVSIGVQQLVVVESGQSEGETFQDIAIELAPNHLAILPHGRGACSNEDGCGVPRTTKQLSLALSKARHPKFNGTSTRPWADVDKSLAAFIRGANRDLDASVSPTTSVADLPAAHRRNIAGKTLLGDPEAESLRDLVFFPVVEPVSGRLNRNALFAVKGGRGEQAQIPESTRKSARAMADRLLASEFGVRSEESEAESCSHCSNKAGFGTDHPGVGNCKYHGGAAPKRLAASDKVSKSKYCGRRLAAVLQQMIAERDDEEDAIVGRVATAANVSESRVRRVLSGEEQFVPEQIIEAFGLALNFSPGVLFAAASRDIGEFMETVDGSGDDESLISPGFMRNIRKTVMSAATAAFQALGGRKQMDRKQLIDEIIERGGWEAESRKVLEDEGKFSEEALKAMHERLPGKKPETKKAEGDPPAEPVTAGKPKDEGPLAAQVKEAVTAAVRAEYDEREKRELVTQLTALEQRTGLNAESLGKLDLETLRTLSAKHAAPTRPYMNFVGGDAAGGETKAESAMDRAKRIPVMYANQAALESAQAAYSGRKGAKPN